MPRAAEQGFAPDSLVCTGDTPEGRPSPLMIYKRLLDTRRLAGLERRSRSTTPTSASPRASTPAPGRVGVAVSGNVFGLRWRRRAALAPADFARRRDAAYKALREAGAHYVIDSAADLLPALARIEGRLARGERP